MKNKEYLKGIRLPKMDQILVKEDPKDDKGRNFRQFRTKIEKELQSG